VDGDFYYRGMNDQQNAGAAQSPALLEVTRGTLVESLHRGLIAAVDSDGEVIASLGDIGTKTWFRSAAKPFQTIAMIWSGAAEQYDFSDRQLAVIAGSHSGEDIHIDEVRTILGAIELDETALLCGPHMPFDETAARKLRAAGKAPTSIHNNCSGKHAGMLAFAKRLGAPIENYIAPDHPIQIQNRIVTALFADLPVDQIAVAVDGCSAPVFGAGVEAMALSYAQLMNPAELDLDPAFTKAAERVVKAMTEYPEMVGGTSRRLDTDLMRATRGGVLSKVGAEGVQLLGVKPNMRYPKGLGVAIKIEDGDIRRARDPVVIETLRQLGVLDADALESLARYADGAIFNYRKIEVGRVRPCFKL
jgi:L-asparaginase II